MFFMSSRKTNVSLKKFDVGNMEFEKKNLGNFFFLKRFATKATMPTMSTKSSNRVATKSSEHFGFLSSVILRRTPVNVKVPFGFLGPLHLLFFSCFLNTSLYHEGDVAQHASKQNQCRSVSQAAFTTRVSEEFKLALRNL